MTGNVRLINQMQILAGESVLFCVQRDIDARELLRPSQRDPRKGCHAFNANS
jgi:hypothetical protein